MTATDPSGPVAPRTKRRRAAGEDPLKRDQILDGAVHAFFCRGFDGASMNDVCRAANVSKGTLYVYFTDKVDLFEAMVARERDLMFQGVQAILTSDLPLPEKLRRFGNEIAEILCSDRVVRTHRMIIGAAETMPDLGARFYDSGARRGQAALLDILKQEVAKGRLRLPDPDLAAYQFIELCIAGMFRQRLLAKAPTPPDIACVSATVDSAVSMFLAAYGVAGGSDADTDTDTDTD